MSKRYILCIILFLLLDQITKYYVSCNCPIDRAIGIFPYLALYYSENKGIAFSFFEGYDHILLSLISFIILLFMIYNLFNAKNILTSIGYSLIISGAIGNLIDRTRLGYVIDFIYFHIDDIFHFAIFNLADSFITIGVICLIMNEIKSLYCKKT